MASINSRKRAALTALIAALTLAALSAVISTGAQAKLGDKWGHQGTAGSYAWTVAGKPIAVQKSEPVHLVGEPSAVFNLSYYGGASFDVSCSSSKWVEASIINVNSSLASGKIYNVAFSGCTVGKQYSSCELAKGQFTMSFLRMTLSEASGKSYVTFESENLGNPLGTFQFRGENCPMAGYLPLRGTFSALVEPSGIERVEQPLTISSTSGSHLTFTNTSANMTSNLKVAVG